MKETDNEKLKRIVKLWSALRAQIEERAITKDELMTDEFLQWAVTTPLYNIGEQVYGLSRELKDQHPDIPWVWYPVFVTGWFTTTKASTGRSSSGSFSMKWTVLCNLSRKS